MKTLGLREAAEFLRIHHVTLAEKAACGEVRGCKPGKEWVFREDALVAYLISLENETPKCHSTSEAKSIILISRSGDKECILIKFFCSSVGHCLP